MMADVQDTLSGHENTNGLLLARATSATHFGTGSGEGVIDLPVARATDTGLPIGPGSAVRGACRAACREALLATGHEAVHTELFGPEFGESADAAGILQIDDMQILAMPVRSAVGMAVWVTSPSLLSWFHMALSDAGLASRAPNPPTANQLEDRCWASEDVCWRLDPADPWQLSVYDVGVERRETGDEFREQWASFLSDIYAQSTVLAGLFTPRLVVVPDAVMAYLAEVATERRTRIRRKEDGTTDDKALWQEEHVVRDTLWFAPWSAQPERKSKVVREMGEVKRWLTASNILGGGPLAEVALHPKRVQMGGKGGVHKGRFEVRYL